MGTKKKSKGPLLPITSPVDIKHRTEFEKYVIRHAVPEYRENLTTIYNHWHFCNDEYFEGKLQVPYIMLTQPGSPRILADYCAVSSFGGITQIRIRPAILEGNHSAFEDGTGDFTGIRRYLEDVVLHEMGHQKQFEEEKKPEHSYHGHGPVFRDICNRIGLPHGWREVRTGKNRGKNKHLPSCAYWPSNARPTPYQYYCGAVTEPGLDDSHPIPAKPKPAAKNDELPVFTAPLSPEEWKSSSQRKRLLVTTIKSPWANSLNTTAPSELPDAPIKPRLWSILLVTPHHTTPGSPKLLKLH